MDKNDFKPRLITKLVVGGAFTVLTIAACVGIPIVNNDVIAPNEGFITNALCKIDTGVKNNMGDKLAVEIEREGIVLAKNATNQGEDKPVLPLASSVTKVNVFGYDSVQWIISNSGSGSAAPGTGQKAWGILDALDDKGITYNQDIISYYRTWSNSNKLDRSTLSYNGSHTEIYALTNPSLSNNSDYLTRYEAAKGDVDTAIVVISRYGGEHLDPPHEQVNNKSAKSKVNTERGYLEITTEEEELLTRVGQDYKNVIVLINSTNTMQMDFMERIPGLDACLLVGPTGTVGAKAITQIMWGEYAPSGRTADTWPMNHRYNPAYWTSGYFAGANGDTGSAAAGNYYTNVPSGANLANSKSNTGHGHAVFSDYIEGIYVGYKWYETADYMGYWNNDTYTDYNHVVAYPFGFGLNYTTFDWKLVETKPGKNSNIKENQDIEIKVEVTNTGDVPGKDVVEAYLTAQYYPGEIEKSYVKLVGFQKTNVIMPGKSETVTLKLKTRDFLQFDCYDANNNGHSGYELDRGSYEIKLMKSAHHIKEEMGDDNTIKYNVPNTINVYEDPETGNPVQPLFTGSNAIDGVSCDGKSIGEPIEYLTRENFKALPTSIIPTRPWNPGLVTCDDNSKPTAYSTNMAREWDNATTDVFGNDVDTSEPLFGQDNGLQILDEKDQLTDLGTILAADYDAPEWEDVLDKLNWAEATAIQKGQSYHRPGLSSVGLKDSNNTNSYNDAEGASQVGGEYSDGRRNTAYPDPCVQGQCWSETMLYLFGLSESKDMGGTGNDYLYGPASNIHRSPYGGRHAVYHSEDGFLAGKCLSNVTKGLADGGKSGFIKHFALNDTEYHRVGLFTWVTEQALREVYLRPFEEAVKNGNACALMSSFNRIGAVWTGGSQALMQGVLRNEWGFKAMTITDYTENGTLQDANQQFRAGGNFILGSSNFNDPGESNATPRYKNRLRESAKQFIYGSIRPQYLNWQYNENPENRAIVSFASKSPWVWWKPTLYGLEGLVIAGFAFGIFAALWPGKQEFREELLARLFKKKKDEPEAEQGKEDQDMKKVLNWILNHMVLIVGIIVFGIALGVGGGAVLKTNLDYKNYEAKYDENDLEVRSMYDAQPKRIEIDDKFVSYNADGSIKSDSSGRKNSLNVTPDQFKVTTSQQEYVTEGGYLDLTTSGGKVELKFTLPEKSFLDIVFVVSSENAYQENGKDKYGVKDLISNVNFVINNQTMEDDVTLENENGTGPEWHNLVMAGFALPAGQVNISIQSISNKQAMMPNIRNISLFTTQPLTAAE